MAHEVVFALARRRVSAFVAATLAVLVALVLIAQLTSASNPAFAGPGDTDGDGCPDMNELQPSPMSGGQRNFLNPWDYWNPTHDGLNRIDDPLLVKNQYFIDQGEPGYNPDTDRTLVGPNGWNAGPPDGKQRVDDMLYALFQYYHDCA